MPTRDEAAEALYRAVVHIEDGRPGSAFIARVSKAIDAANAYRDSTPDPLPAEVQRVLEAAGHVIHTTRVNHPDAADAWDDLESAVDAYRSTQPEPLSARLARLKPGWVVMCGGRGPDPVSVLGIDEHTGRFFGRWWVEAAGEWKSCLFFVREITGIVFAPESP